MDNNQWLGTAIVADDFERKLRTRTRVDKLMALANHADTPPHEAAAARQQAEKLAKMYDIPLEGGPVTRPSLRPNIEAAEVDIGNMFDMFRGSIKKQHPVSYLDKENEE